MLIKRLRRMRASRQRARTSRRLGFNLIAAHLRGGMVHFPMADVVVRRAGADDAFIVAALHLQFAGAGDAVGAGVTSTGSSTPGSRSVRIAPRGSPRRAASAWHPRDPPHRALPWPGRRDVGWLHVGGLFVTPESRDLGVAAR